MTTMTFLSLLGHIVAFLTLLMLSWIQPIRIKKPTRRPITKVQLRTPARATPALTRIVPKRTPKPTVVKTKIIRKKTPKPTPKPTKTKRPTKRPTKKPTKRPTKRPTPKPTPRKTRPPTPRPTRRQTPPPKSTPSPDGPVVSQKSELSEYPFYVEYAQTKIASNFSTPRHLKTPGVTCLVQATIFRDGRIENIRILRSTGDPMLDGYAIRALNKSTPLQPLPDVLKVQYVVQKFEFDFSLQAN